MAAFLNGISNSALKTLINPIFSESDPVKKNLKKFF
jgi:hypothetical protein